MIVFNTVLPVITMIAGFYFGFRIGKDKEIPEVKTPKKIIEEYKEEKKEKETKKQLETYIENIDNYPNNQQEVR